MFEVEGATKQLWLFYKCTMHKCLGSGHIDCGSGSSILGRITIRIQGFDDQKLRKKLQLEKNLYFYYQKLQFTYGSIPCRLHKGRPSYRNSL